MECWSTGVLGIGLDSLLQHSVFSRDHPIRLHRRGRGDRRCEERLINAEKPLRISIIILSDLCVFAGDIPNPIFAPLAFFAANFPIRGRDESRPYFPSP